MNILRLSLLSLIVMNVLVSSEEPVFDIPTSTEKSKDIKIAKRMAIGCVVLGGLCALARRVPGAIMRYRTVLRPDVLTGTHFVEHVLSKKESIAAFKHDFNGYWNKIKPDHVTDYSPVTEEAMAAELSTFSLAPVKVFESSARLTDPKAVEFKKIKALPSALKSTLDETKLKLAFDMLVSKEQNESFILSGVRNFDSNLTKMVSYFPYNSIGEHRLYESLKRNYPKYSWLDYQDFKFMLSPLIKSGKMSKFYVDHLDNSGVKTPCIDFSKLK